MLQKLLFFLLCCENQKGVPAEVRLSCERQNKMTAIQHAHLFALPDFWMAGRLDGIWLGAPKLLPAVDSHLTTCRVSTTLSAHTNPDLGYKAPKQPRSLDQSGLNTGNRRQSRSSELRGM